MKSNATISEMINVEIMDVPMWFPSSSTIGSAEKIKGRKTVTVVSVAARMDRHTSVVPWVTALSGS